MKTPHKSKTSYHRTLSFYEDLYSALMRGVSIEHREAFNLRAAFHTWIMKEGRCLSIEQIKSMSHAVIAERAERNTEIRMVTQWVFRDLVTHFHDLKARQLVSKWRDLAGYRNDEIFIYVRSWRPCDPNNQLLSPIAATIVANSTTSLDLYLNHHLSIKRVILFWNKEE